MARRRQELIPVCPGALLVSLLLAALSIRTSAARSLLTVAPAAAGHLGPRALGNFKKRDKCVVEDWPFCLAQCPGEIPLKELLGGGYGAQVGEFLAAPVDELESTTVLECCRACTEFNGEHFSDIFGYICDYWSWEHQTGRCALFDKNILCQTPSHFTHTQFNESRTAVLSFPAAC